MNMNKLFILATAAAFFWGCSDDKHTNTWEDENEGSSYAEESFKSSSSLTTRLDINYNDTLQIGDTAIIVIERAQLDTVKKKDTTYVEYVCSEDALCIDSTAKQISMFLGDFPAGSRISVSAYTSDMKKDTIKVRGELGDILKTSFSVYDSSKKSEVFSNYMIPGHKDPLKNEFIVFKDGFYYLDLNAKFSSTSHLHLFVEVDTAYYDYIGDTNEVAIGLQDTLRGIAVIGSSPKEINVKFSSGTGYSINLEVKGEWINSFEFYEGKELVASSDTSMEQLLLPEDSSSWTLKVKPLNIENYLSGPYAVFEAITDSRELGQGEYLAYPDSLVKPGDVLEVVRERNNRAKYYLRQEQYVWLADMKKGDSIDVYQEMLGYFGGVNNKSYTIVNKKGEKLASIGALDNRYKATKDGPVYLHYLSTCPYLSNDNDDESLKFKTHISYYGSLKDFSFYSKTEQSIIDTTYIVLGDTVVLSEFMFRTQPSTASSNMKWFTPCEDIVPHLDETEFMTTPVFDVQNIDCKDNSGKELLEGEQQISTLKLIPAKDSEGGSFRLIAESVADPLKRDTLTIIVQ